MTHQPAGTISFTLVENAIDFLQSAVASVKAKEEHPRSFKYGILHLCDGIELLLKCRLSAEHWTLIVADIDRTSAKDVQSGDFKSVAWEEAITRVEKSMGREFAPAEKALLRHLRNLRNRIQHFDVQLPRAECEAILAQGLHFATQFVEAELSDQDLAEELKEIHVDLSQFQKFVEVRMEAIRSQLGSLYAVRCPKCLQQAMQADGDRSKCLFCGYDEDGEAAAGDWVDEFCGFRSLKDEMAEPRVEECPECSSTALVEISRYLGEDAPQYYCFACGTHGEFDHCVLCNGLFQPMDEETACSDCLWEKVHGDDD